jgi:hypothetical protein
LRVVHTRHEQAISFMPTGTPERPGRWGCGRWYPGPRCSPPPLASPSQLHLLPRPRQALMVRTWTGRGRSLARA